MSSARVQLKEPQANKDMNNYIGRFASQSLAARINQNLRNSETSIVEKEGLKDGVGGRQVSRKSDDARKQEKTGEKKSKISFFENFKFKGKITKTPVTVNKAATASLEQVPETDVGTKKESVAFKEMTVKEIERRLEKSLGRSRSKNKDRLKEGLHQTYYMKSLRYYLGLKNKKSEIVQLYYRHFLQSIAAVKFCRKLRPVSDEAIFKSQVKLARLEESAQQSTHV